ncbi:hypothetical protein K0M31_014081 [Melipona bicolor]|uniref:Uncharacterized protein n=1 Tax=Melipona bicolor TaxID=60889 RepID=A0AA40G903_9HYME|nr:hypothetical protein K0M31_014081 [Melipona bicolor]
MRIDEETFFIKTNRKSGRTIFPLAFSRQPSIDIDHLFQGKTRFSNEAGAWQKVSRTLTLSTSPSILRARDMIMKSCATEPESLRKKGKEKRPVMRVRECIRAPIGNTDTSEKLAGD